MPKFRKSCVDTYAGKVDWDWGAVLYALYEETNGENESFLQIAANLRKEYRKDLLNL